MSGIDRPDFSQMGMAESSAAKNVLVTPDGARYEITEEIGVLKKYDGDWTAEQMDAGEADHALAEVITTKNGTIIDRWVRGDIDGGG